MNTSQMPLHEIFSLVSEDKTTPRDALKSITPQALSKTIYPTLSTNKSSLFSKGITVQSGDVSGRLILGRDIAKKIVEARASGKQIEQYIYSTANGDIEDFLAIEHCSAYFTSNPARTEFCAVQSVLEGKPTIIAADVEFHECERPHSTVTGTSSTSKSGCCSKASTRRNKRGGKVCGEGLSKLFSSLCCKNTIDAFS